MPEKEVFSTDAIIDEFEATTRRAGVVQIETLRRILIVNAEAEYLRNLGLAGRTDVESFKFFVPLMTHRNLEPLIQRIADGDSSSVLTGKPIPCISLSSGTTQGKPKFVPFNDELVNNTMQIYRTSFAFRNRDFPIGKGKALQFIYGSKQFTTKGGLPATTATTNVFRSPQFKHTMKDIQSQCCSPDEVIFSPDFNQTLYCHLLCGLIFSNQVQYISSTFAHSIVHAFRTFEHIWDEICVDIKDGLLSSKITIKSIRDSVSKLLSPNPNLAESIRTKCMSLSSWYGVMPALWPNAKYVYGIMTGSMEPYLKKLRHYAGGLPLVASDYGASEGWIAANIHPKVPPELATFAVLPDIGFFEFIPLRKKHETVEPDISPSTAHYVELDPVGLTEVKVDEEYEVVVTNFAGLYRYRLGDVVKVTGFHNSTPLLQFICRRSLLLSVNIDKNTEKDLQLAVEAASSIMAAEKIEVVDFTSCVDHSLDSGHYVIFWELSNSTSNEVLGSCCDCLDRSFVDAGYVGSRKVGGIGPLELRVVQRGTFEKILEHYLSQGAAVSQFKAPRWIGPNNAKVLQILCSNVVASYFSNTYSSS